MNNFDSKQIPIPSNAKSAFTPAGDYAAFPNEFKKRGLSKQSSKNSIDFKKQNI